MSKNTNKKELMGLVKTIWMLVGEGGPNRKPTENIANVQLLERFSVFYPESLPTELHRSLKKEVPIRFFILIKFN